MAKLAKFSTYMVLCKYSINVISAINSKEVVQCNEDSKISILQELLDGRDQTLVCTSSLIEALQLKKVCFLHYKYGLACDNYVHIQLLQVHSWSVYHVTDQYRGSDTEISAEVIGEYHCMILNVYLFVYDESSIGITLYIYDH